MNLTDLVIDLKLDLGNEGLLGDEYLTRCIKKAFPDINRDIETAFLIENDVLSPDPSDEHKEFLLLRAHIHVCSLMRTKTAENFVFSSADKKVDKTKQPEFWKGQEEALLERYKKKVKAINPGNSSFDDDVLAVGGVTPLIYEIETEEEDS